MQYMKAALAMLLSFFFQQNLSAQQFTGVYVLQSDTTKPITGTDKTIAVTQFVPYPNLYLKKDGIFSWNWNAPADCIMGTISGIWHVYKDTLFLKESVYESFVPGGRHIRYPGLSTVHIYRVSNLNFTYLYTIYGTDSLNTRSSLGNFRFYKESTGGVL